MGAGGGLMDRDALLRRFASVRAATEALAAPLSAEDQQLQSMDDASPTKWHRAHTTWFFEEFLLGPAGVAPCRPEYRYLFNSYYEAVGPRHPRPRRGLLSRPSCDEVAAYRRAVDGRMRELLGALDDDALTRVALLVELGLAHEEQHQELLLTDILHALAQSPLRPAYRASAPPTAGARVPSTPAPLRFVRHDGGLCEIGDDGDLRFTFDNEGPRHRVWVEPFELASRPVSVGEVRAFIDAGGYETPALWLAEGFDWVRREGVHAPLYTERDGATLRGFTLDGDAALDPDAPASHLSYYEADAIARFLGGRLPTEAEWEVVAARVPVAGNDRASGALRPVAAGVASVTEGVGQLFGDVWEWTSSAYAPYPGFTAAAGAVGEYNGKFMVSQLVLRGGSCLTPPGHVRPTYRNFWPPHTRFQMTGARVARSVRRGAA